MIRAGGRCFVTGGSPARRNTSIGTPSVIVASLATYGVGYLARPIGAFVLGHWGDTRGRKTVLLLCMFLTGFSTMAVGMLPTHRIHLNDLGHPGAVPVPKLDYERMREQTLAKAGVAYP